MGNLIYRRGAVTRKYYWRYNQGFERPATHYFICPTAGQLIKVAESTADVSRRTGDRLEGAIAIADGFQTFEALLKPSVTPIQQPHAGGRFIISTKLRNFRDDNAERFFFCSDFAGV